MPRRFSIVSVLTLLVLAALAGWQLHKALKLDAESAYRICEVICLGVSACLAALALAFPCGPQFDEHGRATRRLGFLRWFLAGCFCIFLAVGLVCGSHVEARFLCRGLCVLWGAGLAVTTLTLNPAPQVGGKALGSTCSLIVGNVAVLAVLGELALRILAPCLGPERLLLDTAGGYRLTPGLYPHGLRVNSLGFAGDEFQEERRPGIQRIVWLGDSFSVATAMSHEANYVSRIERGLESVEVFNFGVCGTGPREYAELLHTLGWRYRPDLVIVPIFIGNDITEPLPTPALTRFDPDGLYTARAVRRAFCLVCERLRQAESPFARIGFDARAPLSEATHLRVEAGRLEICLRTTSALVERRWGLAFDALEGLLTDCRAHGTPVGILLLPAEFQVNPELRSRLLVLRGWDEAQLDITLPQRRLQSFFAERGVPCLDLLRVFAAAPDDTYLPHDTHWSETGHALAASAAIPWLKKSFPSTAAP